MTLRDDWPEPGQIDLVGDYIDWLAPRLLTLSGLSDQTRERLERAARTQALAVEQNYPLYPKVIDRTLIDTARVEARLRRANKPEWNSFRTAGIRDPKGMDLRKKT